MALRKKTNKPRPKRKSATRTKDKPSREKPDKKTNGSAGNHWHRTKAKRGRARPPLKPKRPVLRARR